mgnify:CR=1 FL=1
MAIDVLITPASGSIYISGSEAQTPTPPNLTNGSNYLWASGTTLQWGSQEVYTNTPGSSEITGGGSANQVAYYSASTTIAGSANLTFDGTNLKLGDSKKLLLGAGSDFQLYHQGDASSYIYNASNGLFIWNNVTSGGVLELRSDDITNGIKFDIGGTDKMFINNLGFGIGITPSYPLHINHASGAYAIETTNTNSRGLRFGDTSGDGTGYGKIEGKGGSLFLGSTQIYTSFIGTADTDVTLGQANRRWGYFYSRYGQIGYSNGQAESVAAGGYVLGVSGNADRHPFMVKAYGKTTPNFIVASGGNVGIGTSSPDEYLEVRSSANDDPAIRLTNNRSGASGSLVLQHRGSSVKIKSENDQPMGFVMDSTEVITIHSDNNVGIGTLAPEAKLDVRGTVIASGNIDTHNRVRYGPSPTYMLDFSNTSTGLTLSGYQSFRPTVSGNAAGNGQDLGMSTYPWDKVYSQGLTLSNQTAGDSSPGAKSIWVSGSDVYWGTSKLNAQSGGSSVSFGSDNQIPFTNAGGNDFDYSANFTYDGLNLTLASAADVETSRGLSIKDNEGTETIRLGTSTSDHGLFYLRGATGGNAIYLDGGAGTNYLNAGDVGIGNTTAIGSAKLTVRDTSDPQLTLAYDGTYYTTLKTDSAGDFHVNLTSGGTFNFGQSAGNEYFKFLRGNGSGIMSLRDSGHVYFDGGNVIFETASQQYFQLKGTNVLGFGSGRDFSMSASGNVFYMTSGASHPSATPILGIKQNGNVGIGTNAPNEKLEIAPDTDVSAIIGRAVVGYTFSDYASFTHYQVRGDTGAYALLQNDTGGTYLNAAASKPIYFRINNSDKMRLTSDGNLGIGTTSPDAKLEVLSTTDQLQLTHTDASKYNSFHTDDGGGLSIYSNGTARANRKVFVSGNSIIMGQYAGYDLTHNQTGEHVIIGDQAGYELTGAETHGRHTIIGAHAVHTMTGGADSDYVTAIGAYCAYGAKPTKGFTALGPFAGYYLSGSGDGPLLLGAGAGKGSAFAAWGTDNSVTMNEDVLIGNGGVAEYAETLSQNTIVGSRAAGFMRIGTQNVAIGRFAMRNASGSAGTTGNIAIGQSAGQGIGKLGSADYNIAIGYENQEKALIGDKNIAIGYKVGIDGDNTETSILRIGNASGDYSFIKGDMANNNLWVGAGTPKFAITGSKVGIGQNNPSAKFHVTNDSSDSQWAAYIDQNNTGNVALKIEGTYGLGIETSGQFPLDISTASSADALRMLDNGNLGLGTTSPGEKLDVVGNARIRSNLSVATTSQPTSSQAGMRVAGIIQLDEKGSVPTHAAGTGILWVKNDAPANLYFTDDDDNDIALTDNGSAAGGGGTPGGSDTQIQFNNGGAFGGVSGFTTTDDGSDVTLTSATASKPVFTIENTNADNNPSSLVFYKNTASPASSDQVGSIKFNSKEATSGDTKTYWEIQSRINDPTNTTPNGQLNFYGLDGDSPGFIHQFQFINSQFSVLNSDGVGPTISPTGTNGALFKSAGSKMRLQAKSDSTGEIHMMAHNVGINTTSPAHKLSILDGTVGGFINPRSSTATVSMGAYTAHPLQIYAGGDEAIRITASRNVGIGTTSPNSKMTVQGDLDIPVNSRFRAGSGDSNHTGVDIYHDGSNNYTLIENRPSGGDLIFRQMHNGKDYIFKADNDSGTEQEIMRIDGSNARVGIGTTSPSYELDISSTDPQIGLTDTNGYSYYIMAQSDKFWIGNSTAGTTPLVIDSAGDVGIGTTAPNVKLHVNGDARIEAGHKLYFDDTGTGEYIYATGNDLRLHSSDHLVLDAEDQVTVRASDFAWETDGASEKMRFKADTGRLGIGINAPGAQLDIHQTADDSAFEIAGYDDKSGVTAKMHVASNGMAQFVGSSHTQVQATTDSVYISAAEHLYLDNGTRNTYSTIFRDGTGEYARFKNARFGLGTIAPAEHLHVESDSNTQALFKSTDNRGLIQVADDDTTVSLVAEGTKASLGMTSGLNAANLNITAVGHIGIGNTAPTFGVDVSGASTRTAMANVPYIYDIHAGFIQAAAIQPNAGNIAMIAPDTGTGPAGTTIPVYLPSTAAETTGLEITVVQDVAQNPGAALAVAGALGTSDAIYEGGSNSASATVSIAANRGANKTFINVASGVWVLKE